MFTKIQITALALTDTLAFASTAQAEDVSLERYVSSMVNQAMEVAQQELKNNVRSAVLTFANNVSFVECVRKSPALIKYNNIISYRNGL